MSDRPAKDKLFDAFASVAKVLGSGRRAEIVDVLAQGERPVDEIAEEIGQSIANASQHPQQPLRAGPVRTRREGMRIDYPLSSTAATRIMPTPRPGPAPPLADPDKGRR